MKGLTDLVGQRVTVFTRAEWGDLVWNRWLTGRVRAVALYPASGERGASTFHFLVQLEEDHRETAPTPYNMKGALLHIEMDTHTAIVPEGGG